MVDTTETVVNITIDGREALVKHITDLQAVITRKNEQIEALTAENEKLINEPMEFIDRVRNQAYQEGWNSCKQTIKKSIAELNGFLDREDF